MLIGNIVPTASGYSAASAQKNNKERKEKLSIYLAKNLKISDLDLLKLESANPPVELFISGLETVRLYMKKEPPKHSPPWTQLFTSRPEVTFCAFGSSSVG